MFDYANTYVHFAMSMGISCLGYLIVPYVIIKLTGKNGLSHKKLLYTILINGILMHIILNPIFFYTIGATTNIIGIVIFSLITYGINIGMVKKKEV